MTYCMWPQEHYKKQHQCFHAHRQFPTEYEAWRQTQLQPPQQNVNLVRAIDEHMCLLWRTYMQIQILRFTPVHGSYV